MLRQAGEAEWWLGGCDNWSKTVGLSWRRLAETRFLIADERGVMGRRFRCVEVEVEEVKLQSRCLVLVRLR